MQHAYLLHRHIQLIVTGVGNQKVITMHTADIYVFYAHIAADTVNFVHHVITSADIRKILQLLPLVFTMQTFTLLHAKNIIFG